MKLLSRLFSTPQPAKRQKVDTVGAFEGVDPFDMYTTTLKWIKDTRKKLPNSTTYAVGPEEREEAYHQDPLLSGIITQFQRTFYLVPIIWKLKTTRNTNRCLPKIPVLYLPSTRAMERG